MDKDIKEMFQEKNKAILISNLKYDLEKNINSLLETVINIFNLEFDTAIRNMTLICQDSGIKESERYITKCINEMKLSSYEEIEKLLMIKKDDLLGIIDHLEFEEKYLQDYYDHVFNTTKVFKKEFASYCVHDVDDARIEKFKDYLLEQLQDRSNDLVIQRITDYLKNRLYGKLETKIHMELMLRDNNLINKAKESYLRYQEITSKTVKN